MGVSCFNANRKFGQEGTAYEQIADWALTAASGPTRVVHRPQIVDLHPKLTPELH